MSEQLKNLPVGNGNFEKIISSDYYYVDKTSLLKTIFKDDSSEGLLITRPRRFGKTLTLDMFKCFLALNPQNPQDKSKQERLFCDKQIYKDKDFCNEFMGEYPVISVSFKDVNGDSFDFAYYKLAETIISLAESFDYLLESSVLNEREKEKFKRLIDFNLIENNFRNEGTVSGALKLLAELLYKHHQKQVILLIDEYDVPLSKASSYGYYEKMLPLVRGLLSVLKGNESVLKKSVVTGCLRVVKESIFTGVNNLKVNTILSDDESLAKAIGFTSEETKDLLDYYGLSELLDKVKEHYDGYNLASNDIYSAWDLISFTDEANTMVSQNQSVEFNNFWVNTSSNDIIKEFLGHITSEDAEALQTLIDGGSVVKRINPFVTYEDLKSHTSEDFYSMLLYTGYLTVADFSTYTEADYLASLRIPNESVRQCFKHNIYDYFKNSDKAKESSLKIVKAIFDKDANELKTAIVRALRTYISVRDISSAYAKEYYYHGFFNGYFSASGDEISNYKSNAEAGDGYADILFTDADLSLGVVIELKHTDDAIDKAAEKALEQIEKKDYTEIFKREFNISNVLCFGIAFKGKSCEVSFKEITL